MEHLMYLYRGWNLEWLSSLHQFTRTEVEFLGGFCVVSLILSYRVMRFK